MQRNLTLDEFCGLIDHTLLKPDATPQEIQRVCDEAREYGFASVCVNSCYVAMVNELLTGVEVKPCAVVGFPLGAMDTESKAYEAATAVQNGAEEIDMVLNIGRLKAGDDGDVFSDMVRVIQAAGDTPVKVILETCLLTDDEKIRACVLAKRAGAAYVKTSTGFSAAGATVEDVALLRRTVGDDMGVKAAGGIRTVGDVLRMMDAGASRIGTSAGYAMAREYENRPE